LSQELCDFLRQRAQLRPVSLTTCLVFSLAFHAGVAALVLLGPKGAAHPEEPKVTWVNLPAAPSGPLGGSGAQEEGRQGERQRRVEEVAPKPVAPPVKAPPAKVPPAPTPNTFGTRPTQAAKGTSSNPDSMGKAPVAAKGPVVDANPAVGAAGSGSGGGVGVGSPTPGIPGLKATSGISGGTGLISDLDGTFPFLWYLQQVQGRITGNWSRLSSVQGRVQVYFRIRRDGSLEGARVESPSGNATMDQSALMAVKRSDPLPRLPDGFEGSSLGVRFWFTYLGN
jgi:periplasmic protein TonB